MHRAKIIRGQLDGLARAIEREDYCTKLLEQSFAMREALKSLERLLLENHLKTHVVHQFHKKMAQKLPPWSWYKFITNLTDLNLCPAIQLR